MCAFPLRPLCLGITGWEKTVVTSPTGFQHQFPLQGIAPGCSGAVCSLQGPVSVLLGGGVLCPWQHTHSVVAVLALAASQG